MKETRKRQYITPEALQFVAITKLNLIRILSHRGMDARTVSRATGIPESTLSRWLDPELSDFPPLVALVVIADHLGIQVREILADPGFRGLDYERYRQLRPLLELPVEDIEWLRGVHEGARVLFSKKKR